MHHTDVTTLRNLNGLFVAHTGKEPRKLNKVATRIFGTSGPSKASAGPAHKLHSSQATIVRFSIKKITKDPVIINIVRSYQIDFHTKPAQAHIPKSYVTDKDVDVMNQEIMKLITKGP